MSRHCQLPAVEVGPLQGSYQAYCPDCTAASEEAVTVDWALTDFHALHGGGLLEEFASGYFVEREYLLDEGDRPR